MMVMGVVPVRTEIDPREVVAALRHYELGIELTDREIWILRKAGVLP